MMHLMTVSGIIKKGKIILDGKVEAHDGKVLVTFIDEKTPYSFKSQKITGKELKKMHLDGIWKDREIEDSVSYSRELRKKLETRNVG